MKPGLAAGHRAPHPLTGSEVALPLLCEIGGAFQSTCEAWWAVGEREQCWQLWSVLQKESQPFGGCDRMRTVEKGDLPLESEDLGLSLECST